MNPIIIIKGGGPPQTYAMNPQMASQLAAGSFNSTSPFPAPTARPARPPTQPTGQPYPSATHPTQPSASAAAQQLAHQQRLHQQRLMTQQFMKSPYTPQSHTTATTQPSTIPSPNTALPNVNLNALNPQQRQQYLIRQQQIAQARSAQAVQAQQRMQSMQSMHAARRLAQAQAHAQAQAQAKVRAVQQQQAGTNPFNSATATTPNTAQPQYVPNPYGSANNPNRLPGLGTAPTTALNTAQTQQPQTKQRIVAGAQPTATTRPAVNPYLPTNAAMAATNPYAVTNPNTTTQSQPYLPNANAAAAALNNTMVPSQTPNANGNLLQQQAQQNLVNAQAQTQLQAQGQGQGQNANANVNASAATPGTPGTEQSTIDSQQSSKFNADGYNNSYNPNFGMKSQYPVLPNRKYVDVTQTQYNDPLRKIKVVSFNVMPKGADFKSYVDVENEWNFL